MVCTVCPACTACTVCTVCTGCTGCTGCMVCTVCIMIDGVTSLCKPNTLVVKGKVQFREISRLEKFYNSNTEQHLKMHLVYIRFRITGDSL